VPRPSLFRVSRLLFFVDSGESANNSNDGLSDLPPASQRHSFNLPVAPQSAAAAKFSQPRLLNDAEFDTEAELPNLEAVIPKELLRKLKPKEKKRQEVINGNLIGVFVGWRGSGTLFFDEVQATNLWVQ
jgi:hypothetical protein